MVARPGRPAGGIARPAGEKLSGFGAFRLFLQAIYRLHVPPRGGKSRFFEGDHRRTIAILSRTKRGQRNAGAHGIHAEKLALHCKKDIFFPVDWSFNFVNAEAKAELDALPPDMRATFERIVRLVQAVGLERVREPYIKHIAEKLWEMRLKGRDGIARALYMTASGRRIVILRTFVKKTQKTPRREIELAQRRAEEVT